MAVRSAVTSTWQRGVAEPAPGPAAWADASNFTSEDNVPAHYTVADPGEGPTSDSANDFGVSTLRGWPSLFNGTAGGTTPTWWKPAAKVDVLICGGECCCPNLIYAFMQSLTFAYHGQPVRLA